MGVRQTSVALLALLVASPSVIGGKRIPPPVRSSVGYQANQLLTQDENALLDAAGHGDLEKVKQSLAAGARTNVKKSDGAVVLFSSSEDIYFTPLMRAAWNGHPAVVKELLAWGADPNIRESHGRDALILAAARGRIWIVRQLLLAGVDANDSNKDGETALMLAALWPKVLQLLLARGADVNAQDGIGQTVLMKLAAGWKPQSMYVESIKLLLRRGAAVDLRDRDGKTALSIAIENNRSKIADLLKEAGAAQ